MSFFCHFYIFSSYLIPSFIISFVPLFFFFGFCLFFVLFLGLFFIYLSLFMPFSCSSFLYIRFFLLSSFLCVFLGPLVSIACSFVVYPLLVHFWSSFLLICPLFIYLFIFSLRRKKLDLIVSYHCVRFPLFCDSISSSVALASTTLLKFPCFLYMLLPFSISLSIYSSFFPSFSLLIIHFV